MQEEKWMMATRPEKYDLNETEALAVNLIRAEMYNLNQAEKKKLLDGFMYVRDEERGVDFTRLADVLIRLAHEASCKLEEMEEKARWKRKKPYTAARMQLLNEDFASLKKADNPDFKRFFEDLYVNI